MKQQEKHKECIQLILSVLAAIIKKMVLSLHYNGDDSYLFVNSVQQAKLKTANSEILSKPICLGNISKDLSQQD